MGAVRHESQEAAFADEFSALTAGYLAAFDGDSVLSAAVCAQEAVGRPRAAIIANMVASLAPLWCSDQPLSARKRFLRLWRANVGETCDDKADALTRETCRAIGNGLDIALAEIDSQSARVTGALALDAK